jgi:hypothetical protein
MDLTYLASPSSPLDLGISYAIITHTSLTFYFGYPLQRLHASYHYCIFILIHGWHLYSLLHQTALFPRLSLKSLDAVIVAIASSIGW